MFSLAFYSTARFFLFLSSQAKQGFDVIDLAPDGHFARDRECFVIQGDRGGVGGWGRGGFGCRELLHSRISSVK